MARLKTLSLLNWKGWTEDVPLEQVNFCQGGNGTGKSGILAAIQFAITGAVPEGKSVSDAAELCGQAGGSVGVKMGCGFGWTREIRVKAGKAKHVMSVDRSEETAIGKLNAMVAEEVGDVAAMFDLAAMARQSPEVLRNMVLALTQGSGTQDVDAVQAEIVVAFCREALAPADFDSIARQRTPNDAAEDLIRALDEGVRVSLLGIVARLKPVLERDDAVASAMVRAIEQVGDEAKASARDFARSEGTLAQLAGQAPADTDPGLIDELRETHKNLCGRGESVLLEIGAANERASETITLTELQQKTTEEIKTKSEAMDRAVPIETDEAIRTKVEALAAQIKLIVLPRPADPNTGKLGKALLAAKLAEQETVLALGAANAAVAGVRGDLNAATARVEEYKSNPSSRCLELAFELDPIARVGFGFATTEDKRYDESWDELMMLVEKLAAPQRLMDAQEAVEERTEALKRGECDASGAEGTNQEARELRSEIGINLDEAIETYDRDRADLAVAQDRVTTLKNEAEAIQRDHDRAKGDRAKEQTKVDALRVELDATTRRLDELTIASAETLGALSARRDEIDKLMVELDARIKAKTDQELRETEVKTARDAMRTHQVNRDTARMVVVALKAIREKSMASLVKPLTERISWFITAAGFPYRADCRLENENGTAIFDLGCWVDGRRRSLRVLGGRERVVYLAGLAYGIVSLLETPVRLLMIEASEVDERRIGDLIRALVEVGKKGIQVVFATHVRTVDPIPESVNIIECEEIEDEPGVIEDRAPDSAVVRDAT